MRFLEISRIVQDNGFTDGFDETLNCPILDEDKASQLMIIAFLSLIFICLQLLDYLEPLMSEGNNVAEYHSSEFFPERWFQSVYVVRCNTEVLFKRLEQRGYNSKKIQNNVEYEIFQVALDEAKTSYKPEIVFEVRGETEEQLEDNLKKVGEFINNYEE
jgi:adenylate kinase